MPSEPFQWNEALVQALVQTAEDKDPSPEDTEQDLLVVGHIIADWVDIVSNDACEDYVKEMMLPQELAGSAQCGDLEEEFWETVSMGSFEDNCDDGDVLELVPQVSETRSDIGPVLLDMHELLAVKQAAPPSMASPEASPSSRSSTPSRSVRHRRRIIGGVVRTASPAAWGTPFQFSPDLQSLDAPICPKTPLLSAATMKRAASTSALAMDLGALSGHALGDMASPVINWRRGAWQTEFCSPPALGIERHCVKSKSMGALHTSSFNHGLGLAPPAKRCLLPALAGRESSKADLISWSVNMTNAKRGGLRLVF